MREAWLRRCLGADLPLQDPLAGCTKASRFRTVLPWTCFRAVRWRVSVLEARRGPLAWRRARTRVRSCSLLPVPRFLTSRRATSTICCSTEKLRAAATNSRRATGYASTCCGLALPSTIRNGAGRRGMDVEAAAPTLTTGGGRLASRSPLRALTALPRVWQSPRLKGIGLLTGSCGTSCATVSLRAALSTSLRRTAFAAIYRSLGFMWTTSGGSGARRMGAPARAPAIGTTTGGVPGGMLLAESCLLMRGRKAAGLRSGSGRRSRCARPQLVRRLPMFRLPLGPPRWAWPRSRLAGFLLRMPP